MSSCHAVSRSGKSQGGSRGVRVGGGGGPRASSASRSRRARALAAAARSAAASRAAAARSTAASARAAAAASRAVRRASERAADETRLRPWRGAECLGGTSQGRACRAGRAGCQGMRTAGRSCRSQQSARSQRARDTGPSQHREIAPLGARHFTGWLPAEPETVTPRAPSCPAAAAPGSGSRRWWDAVAVRRERTWAARGAQSSPSSTTPSSSAMSPLRASPPPSSPSASAAAAAAGRRTAAPPARTSACGSAQGSASASAPCAPSERRAWRARRASPAGAGARGARRAGALRCDACPPARALACVRRRSAQAAARARTLQLHSTLARNLVHGGIRCARSQPHCTGRLPCLLAYMPCCMRTAPPAARRPAHRARLRRAAPYGSGRRSLQATRHPYCLGRQARAPHALADLRRLAGCGAHTTPAMPSRRPGRRARTRATAAWPSRIFSDGRGGRRPSVNSIAPSGLVKSAGTAARAAGAPGTPGAPGGGGARPPASCACPAQAGEQARHGHSRFERPRSACGGRRVRELHGGITHAHRLAPAPPRRGWTPDAPSLGQMS